ncbi:hypothetical protein NP061_010010 [Weissella confusa]|uniref:Uncharacterized protein n=1 Tax=Limosilactobacillus reuteri TaxID=1598 RepID=A0A2T5Q1G1_LIMRT|nr:hypothetical protein [Limosilactobacillus reuteri]MCW3764678.1 hypothetical protein [Weissella confusa]PTV01050.1 hypothetical protein DB325_09875 [Limosilactobacillus reuteri]
MYLSQLRSKYSGYTADNFNTYFGKELTIYFLAGSGLTPAFGFDKAAGKSTKEIVGQYLEAYFQGFGVQRVKLPRDFNADEVADLSKIELVNPEACEVNGRIFVRAGGVKAVK